MENDKPIFTITPKYNFIYELFMPTGKKTSKVINNFFIILVIYLLAILLNGIFKINIPADIVPVVKIINGIIIAILVILLIQIVVHIILQIYQYKNTIFTFYDSYMIYEDNFLNQHKKTIQYLNIREVEIRKNVWDRINGYGIIVIYTNADNEFNNGLVIFGVKDPDKWYNKIDQLVHNNTYKAVDSENLNKKIVTNDIKSDIKKDNIDMNAENDIIKKESDFKNSLNNVKDK